MKRLILVFALMALFILLGCQTTNVSGSRDYVISIENTKLLMIDSIVVDRNVGGAVDTLTYVHGEDYDGLAPLVKISFPIASDVDVAVTVDYRCYSYGLPIIEKGRLFQYTEAEGQVYGGVNPQIASLLGEFQNRITTDAALDRSDRDRVFDSLFVDYILFKKDTTQTDSTLLTLFETYSLKEGADVAYLVVQLTDSLSERGVNSAAVTLESIIGVSELDILGYVSVYGDTVTVLCSSENVVAGIEMPSSSVGVVVTSSSKEVIVSSSFVEVVVSSSSNEALVSSSSVEVVVSSSSNEALVSSSSVEIVVSSSDDVKSSQASSSSSSSSTSSSSEGVSSSSSVQQHHTITFQSFGNGAVAIPPFEVIAGVAAQVSGVTLVPTDGYEFSEWVPTSGECTINNRDPLNITCSKSSIINAKFEKIDYTITVTKTGACGTVGAGPYNYSVGAGAVPLIITEGDYCAISSVSSTGLEMTHNGSNFTVTGIMTGNFNPSGNAFNITVAFEKVAMPQVEISFACFLNGTSIDCSQVHTSTLTTVILTEDNGPYTFTPSPKTGYNFGDISVGSNITTNGNTISYTSSGTGVVNINYMRKEYVISVQAEGNGTVSQTSATLNHGEATALPIVSTSDVGYHLTWTGYDGCVVNDQTSLTVTCNDEDGFIKAEFERYYFADVTVGYYHTMILGVDGTLWTTGRNYNGQLGDGSTVDKSTPVQVMTSVASSSTGASHTMILKTDGTLWATGYNQRGQLGDGSNVNKSAPLQVMTGVASVFTGVYHTLVLKTDGILWATGYNHMGQLGDGTTVETNTPVPVMTGVASVSGGVSHTMVLKTNGTLWATGNNYNGQLGDGSTLNKSIPVIVMTDVASVSAGGSHTMILKTNGTLWATGYNSYGQLGDGTTAQRSMPVHVMNDVASVSAGDNFTMILKTDGSLWATGYNYDSQLGDGSTLTKSTPVPVMTGVASVSAGKTHTMILKTNGTLWATGNNSVGQLGDGTMVNKSTPIEILF
ncbi:MAG: hypothetical protein OCD01_08395 [Fibrobacterales bacterium]